MLCAREETFGPSAPVFKFKTEQEAIDASQQHRVWPGQLLYSRDVGRIFRVGEALEYGMVGINVGILATEHVPFGGVKQSGLGREGSHHGMDDYVEITGTCALATFRSDHPRRAPAPRTRAGHAYNARLCGCSSMVERQLPRSFIRGFDSLHPLQNIESPMCLAPIGLFL